MASYGEFVGFPVNRLINKLIFLSDYLTRVIEEDNHTARQLNFALAQENETVLLYAWNKSKKHSQHWQYLAKILAKNQGEVAHVLANFYLNKAYLDKRFSSQPEQATLWYQQVIRLNYPKATIALADLYFHQGKVLEAQNLLAKLNVMALSRTQHDDIAVAAIILTTKIAISLGVLS